MPLPSLFINVGACLVILSQRNELLFRKARGGHFSVGNTRLQSLIV